MRDIPNNFRRREVIFKERAESYTTSSFSEYSPTDSFYGVCKNTFLNETPFEHTSGINISFVDGESFVHFQVDYTKRGDGIVVGTFSMIADGTTIVDDGKGNLFVEDDPSEVIIGNIFYNSGNIFIYEGTLFGGKDALTIDDDTVTFTYRRKVNFIQNKIYLEIDKGEYNNSLNSTFKDSDTPFPFISCIYLFNEDFELIAKAQLSKPISTEVDLFIVLEDLETL